MSALFGRLAGRFPPFVATVAMFAICFVLTPSHAHSAPPTSIDVGSPSPGVDVPTIALFVVIAALLVAAVIFVRRLERKERR